MNLGENIYRLRSEKNMSQGDLADALEVSRQSVSKWENNSAVPELDKLVKMAVLFGMTLDSLISGQTPQLPQQPPKKAPAQSSEPTPQTSGIAAGIVLLCCALVVWLLTNILFALPLFVCGILCLYLKRRRGLWCCWVLLFSATFLLHSGIAPFQPFWYNLQDLMIPAAYPTSLFRLLITLVLNIVTVLMSIWTVRSYLISAIRFICTKKTHLLLGWCLTVLPEIGKIAINLLRIYMQTQHSPFWLVLNYCALLMQWLHLAALLTMLIFTIAKFRA